jgi:thioredoxin reductase (NADPH)
VLDRIDSGGQAGARSKIENYVGFPTGLSGANLANRAVIQAEKFGVILSAPATVVRLHIENGNHVLGLKSGEEVSARCALIATGASYRKLHVDGYERFERSGV